MPDTLNQGLSLKNRLLSVLPAKEFDFLKSNLEPVSLPSGSVIYQQDDPISHVYFPNNGMVSLLSVTEQGQTVEIGYTGVEGMVGLPILLGNDEMPYQAMVQAASEGFLVESKIILELFNRGGIFNQIVLRFLFVILKQTSQTCVCNHFHTIEARLCRWLTVMHERSRNGHLSLTHEFLSQMLGVQRTSIGMIANSLQNAGIIRYSRGKIEITDYERLKKNACECFFIVRKEQEKFLNDKNFPVMSGNGQT